MGAPVAPQPCGGNPSNLLDSTMYGSLAAATVESRALRYDELTCLAAMRAVSPHRSVNPGPSSGLGGLQRRRNGCWLVHSHRNLQEPGQRHGYSC